MDAPIPPLPPPSSPADGADGVQIPTISKPDVEAKLISGPAPKLSFAAVTGKGLPQTKATIRSAWSSMRAQIESRDSRPKEQAQAVWFTNHMNGHIAAIPYQPKLHLINNVVPAIVGTFPTAKRINLSIPGVVLIAFHSADELISAVGTKVECSPSPLVVLPTVFSSGTRIKIRAENTPIGFDDCRELAQKVFEPFGKILLVNQHFVAGTTVSLSTFDFILEIPAGSPQDFMIPRIAAVDNVNILFSWSGSTFCYRCGEGSHTKLQCPKPLDYSLGSTPALEQPLLARALPDPDAPLREPVKKTVLPSPGPGPTEKILPPKLGWNVVRSNAKNKGQKHFLGDGDRSASDKNVSSKPSPKKQALEPKGSTSASRPQSNPAPKPSSKAAPKQRSIAAPNT
ncbi:hypothetical protein BGX24_005013, partial [Mortierella sp. AD032]